MDLGKQIEGLGATSGHASWTSAMSSFMLSHLANLVASGTRTSSGFKKVHLSACARAVNEKFNTRLTAEQIKNHSKTWQKRYSKIHRLRRLSAAGWDEENFIITLDAEHYNSYIQVFMSQVFNFDNCSPIVKIAYVHFAFTLVYYCRIIKLMLSFLTNPLNTMMRWLPSMEIVWLPETLLRTQVQL